MAKDVIYVDINDDVTSLIDKIKNSNEKIIAIVPPKQAGVLQSSINLRLLAKAAKSKKKYLVIITSNPALVKLSALAKIPVAKSLQSKPELAEITALKVSGDDVIDGEQLPVGEIAQTDPKTEAIINEASVNDTSEIVAPAPVANPNIKIPNYKKFQKKLILFSGLGLALIVFIVWAIFFAPKATITLFAKTKSVNINKSIVLTDDSAKAKNEQNIVHAQTQRLIKKRVAEVPATGTKDIGDKASATVKFVNTGKNSITFQAGSPVSASGFNFVITNTVTVPAATVSFECAESTGSFLCPSSAPGSVTAVEAGTKYNGVQGAIGGLPSGVSGTIIKSTTGGTTNVVKVATKADLETATNKLNETKDDAAVVELKNKFDSSMVIINESLVMTPSQVKASSEVDKEAKDGKLVLEQDVEYKLVGINKNKLEDYLSFATLVDDKDKANKKVYDAGLNSIHFSNYNKDNNSIGVVTQTKVGPNITTDQVKEFAKGKNYGEIERHFTDIEGIEKVTVDFRPFWVRTVPKKDSRINVDFKLQ